MFPLAAIQNIQEKGKDELENYKMATFKRIVELATAAFGLVAALAWNELIRNVIDTYIKPKLGLGSGTISLALYAIITTLLAVFVTLQLNKLAKNSEAQNRKGTKNKSHNTIRDNSRYKQP